MSQAIGRENLLELREKYPSLFYSQHWFTREAFMRTLPDEPFVPKKVVKSGQVPKDAEGLPYAVDLAHAFVKDPKNPIWQRYLWCADVDSQHQRVYVGVNDGKLEIHRHLAITERWGTACR